MFSVLIFNTVYRNKCYPYKQKLTKRSSITSKCIKGSTDQKVWEPLLAWNKDQPSESLLNSGFYSPHWNCSCRPPKAFLLLNAAHTILYYFTAYLMLNTLHFEFFSLSSYYKNSFSQSPLCAAPLPLLPLSSQHSSGFHFQQSFLLPLYIS